MIPSGGGAGGYRDPPHLWCTAAAISYAGVRGFDSRLRFESAMERACGLERAVRPGSLDSAVSRARDRDPSATRLPKPLVLLNGSRLHGGPNAVAGLPMSSGVRFDDGMSSR